MTQQTLTANRLGDGLVVYLTELGTWSESVDDARIVPAGADAVVLEAIGKSRESLEVAGPYLIDVAVDDDGMVRPLRYRERIRAWGPSFKEPEARETEPGHFKPQPAPVHHAGT